MAKVIHLNNEEAFDRAYDRELAAVVDNAVPTFARLREEAFESAVKQLVMRAWDAGAAFAARYPMTETSATSWPVTLQSVSTRDCTCPNLGRCSALMAKK